MTPRSTSTPPPLVWWIIWAAISLGLIVISLVLRPAKSTTAVEALRYVPLLPLFVSAVLRWWVLPRRPDGSRAFVLFVIGLALAEAGTILGLVLVPALKETYLVAGLLMVAQFAPTFARRYVTTR